MHLTLSEVRFSVWLFWCLHVFVGIYCPEKRISDSCTCLFLMVEPQNYSRISQCNRDGLPNISQIVLGVPNFSASPNSFRLNRSVPPRFLVPARRGSGWAELCRTSPADPIIAAGCWSPERPQGILQTQSRALGVKTVGKMDVHPTIKYGFLMFFICFDPCTVHQAASRSSVCEDLKILVF